MNYIPACPINNPEFQGKNLELQKKDDPKTFGVSSDLYVVSAM